MCQAQVNGILEIELTLSDQRKILFGKRGMTLERPFGWATSVQNNEFIESSKPKFTPSLQKEQQSSHGSRMPGQHSQCRSHTAQADRSSAERRCSQSKSSSNLRSNCLISDIELFLQLCYSFIRGCILVFLSSEVRMMRKNVTRLELGLRSRQNPRALTPFSVHNKKENTTQLVTNKATM